MPLNRSLLKEFVWSELSEMRDYKKLSISFVLEKLEATKQCLVVANIHTILENLYGVSSKC